MGDASPPLSPAGVLVIHPHNAKKHVVQSTDLHTGRQAGLEAEGSSHMGFCDSGTMLLTRSKPLREAAVEDVFRGCGISQFRRVGEEDKTTSHTDVSLLNMIRLLHYRTAHGKLFSYNVDMEVNPGIETKKM